MARKLRHTATAGGRTITLIGDTAKIRRFFPTAQVVDEDDPVVKTVNFRGGVRRRFPGGPGAAFSGGTRTVVVGPRARQQTLPGEPIKCEETTGSGDDRETRVTQFTLVGSFAAAWVVAKATATRTFVLRSPQGKPLQVNGVAPTP